MYLADGYSYPKLSHAMAQPLDVLSWVIMDFGHIMFAQTETRPGQVGQPRDKFAFHRWIPQLPILLVQGPCSLNRLLVTLHVISCTGESDPP